MIYSAAFASRFKQIAETYYLNNHGSRKVLQWKLDIQHYDAVIEHVPGEENIPADVLAVSSQNQQKQHLTKSWFYSVRVPNGH